MGRNRKSLKYQLMLRLDNISRIGFKKHTEQLKNQKDGKGYKSDYIHSIRTLELYKNEASNFINFLNSSNCDYKNFDDIKRSDVKSFIESRNNLSAWTSHLTLAAMNKLFNFNLTTDECGLKKRHIKDIRNNRNIPIHRTTDLLKNSEQIKLLKACGCRRSSVATICPANCVLDYKTNLVECIKTVEKGGKLNYYYVLPEYQNFITDLYLKNLTNPNTPFFNEFDKNHHVNSHSFRNEYSCNLYNLLKSNSDNLIGFYNDSDYINYAIDSHKVSYNLKKYGDTYKKYDTMIISLLSQSLGHYRLDVVLNHYLRF